MTGKLTGWTITEITDCPDPNDVHAKYPLPSAAQALAALIPPPVKTADGADLPPWEWSYPRSEAYEAAASAVLPAGWRLYSVIDAAHENAAKDFGATRDDGRAHAFGVRRVDGKPSHLRACLPRAASFGQDPVEQTFGSGNLAAACVWCDEQLAARAT